MDATSKAVGLHTCDHHTDLCLIVFVTGFAFEKNIHVANHRKRCGITLSIREDDKR